MGSMCQTFTLPEDNPGSFSDQASTHMLWKRIVNNLKA